MTKGMRERSGEREEREEREVRQDTADFRSELRLRLRVPEE